jgi:hypothetical protein
MLRHHLRALSLQECCEYVQNRLKVAGGDRTIFTPNALESIHSYSGGIPRVVNVLCDNALLTGYALGRKEIDPGVIREVAEDLSIADKAEARVTAIRPVINTNRNGSGQKFGVESVEARSGIARPEPKPEGIKQVPQNLPASAFVPTGFLDALAAALTDAMGPMAKIVIRDRIKTLGEFSDRFPHAKVDMLLESVSSEILDEGMRGQFQRQMLKQVRALQAS